MRLRISHARSPRPCSSPHKKTRCKQRIFKCGDGEIRTRGAFKGLTSLAKKLVRPLRHVSLKQIFIKICSGDQFALKRIDLAIKHFLQNVRVANPLQSGLV